MLVKLLARGQRANLSKNKDEDHADVHLGLLGHRTHAGIASNTNCNTRSQPAHATAQARTQVGEAGVKGVTNL
jgi:hypothetical protein